jgi:hypothetical protein
MSGQHGFFKGRSTVSNLIEFTTYVLNCMENGVQVDAIYTDFSKAFDNVSHRLLLRKLAKLGFGDSFLVWIGSYLLGREQFLKASGSQSRRFGVFALYFILLYAEDLKIFFPVARNSDFDVLFQ